jgi:NAD(P)-dependent dehydrogenase (short-subunit alcohol dehydrogenase family)
MELKPIGEQVVVVCGASSGIGRETALRFARRGAKVVVAARSEPGLRSLVEEVRADGGQATAVVADVAEFEQVKAVADRAVQEYGRLDTWVHAAAVLLHATFEDTTPEEFKRVIDVNLMGQVYGAMAALPHLKREGRGALIHVSSIEARRALPYHSAYAAAKHGVDGFVEALRVELRKEGAPISVTEVMPATINTPLFSKARTKIGVKPMGAPPFYPPGSVAEAILYAAEHPRRDLVVGGVGKSLVTTQRLSPWLMDEMLLRAGFRLQRTNEPKSADAPDNLFAPIQGYDRSEGDFGKLSFRRSFYTWLQRHPAVKTTAMLGAAAGAAALIDGRAAGNTKAKER